MSRPCHRVRRPSTRTFPATNVRCSNCASKDRWEPPSSTATAAGPPQRSISSKLPASPTTGFPSRESSSRRLDWWIYLETYDPFFLGTWRIVDVKLACNQRVSGVGDGAWTTQLSSGEFGTYGLPEYDDRVTITLGEISDNELTGTLVHSAGDDGAYGNFWGVYAPYSVEAPLDMNPRLRHLLPPGESQWTLDLTTNQMKITQNNVSSTMIFGTEGNNRLFRFLLPSAAGEPGRDSFYDNMWRSSTELFYVMYKVGD